jgi:uncharacterized coiled-coil DUF342 family protein
MTTHLKHIQELHKEITEWKSSIDFVRDEIRVFVKELQEVSSKNTTGEIRPLVSHFESQFIRQTEVSDELYHEVKLADHMMAEVMRENPASEHVLIPDHEELRQKFYTYDKLFTELKVAYRVFLAKWM